MLNTVKVRHSLHRKRQILSEFILYKLIALLDYISHSLARRCTVTTFRHAVGEHLRSGSTRRSVAQRQSVRLGRISQEGEKVPRLQDTVRRSQRTDSQVHRFPPRAKNLLDQKWTTRLRAESLLSLQSLVYKATSSILQVSRADGRSHRRSEVDRRRRPDYEVRRRGPVLCASESLLDRF